MNKKTALFLILSIVFSSSVLSAEEKPAKNADTKAAVSAEKPKDAVAEKVKEEKSRTAANQGLYLNGKKISLNDAVQLVLKNNQDLLSARYDANMADSAYQKFLSKYSVYLGAEGEYTYTEYPSGSSQLMTGKNQKVTELSGSATKMFSTGTTVTAGVKESKTQTDYLDNYLMLPAINSTGTQIGSVPYPHGGSLAYSPALFFSVQQELLKNSFGYSERKQEKILQNVSALQKRAQVSKISGLVAGALVDIWDVTLKKTAKDNASISLKETKKVRDIVAANARLGISETFDLNLYNALFAGAETSYALAEKNYHDSVRKLYRTLNIDFDGALPEVSDVLVLSTEIKPIDLEAALRNAYAKRVDYANAIMTEENARLTLGIARNGELPSLTAGASASYYAQDTTFSKANSDAASFSTPVYGVTVKMTYPLFDTGTAATVRDAEYGIKQAKLQLDKTRKEVRDDVVSKAEMIQVMFTAYQKAKYAREESERYFYSIQNYLRMGKVTSAVVKNALDALTDSRQRELQALVSYNVSLLQMDLATNELLEKYNVNVDQYLSEAQ